MNIAFSMRRRPATKPVAVVTRHPTVFLRFDAPIALNAPSSMAALLVPFNSDLFSEYGQSCPDCVVWLPCMPCAARHGWRDELHRQVWLPGNGNAVLLCS